MKDLRDMNKEGFLKIYDHLKLNTNNFSKIKPKLFQENPQYLLVLRLALGLSQKELTRMIGIKQWVRHFEAGRQNFRNLKLLSDKIKIINNILQNRKILPKEEIIKLWRICKNAREQYFYNFPEPKYSLKRIYEMMPNDFKTQFNILKNETNNFIKFSPELIVQNPQFFAVFRIILNMNIHSFAKIVEKTPRQIRRWESFEDRIMPENAKQVTEKIKSTFEERGLVGNVKYEDVIKNFSKFTFFEPEELEIKKLMDNYSIPYEIHQDLKISGLKGKLNIDFAIPSSLKPIIAIEVSKLSVKKRKDIVHRIAYIDHRFQMLKNSHPKIITIMVINCKKSQENLVKRTILREIMNTDFYFVNEISERLINFLKEKIKKR